MTSTIAPKIIFCGRGAEGGAGEPQLRALLLHTREPEVLGQCVEDGVEQVDWAGLVARHELDGVDPALEQLLVAPEALALGDDHLESVRLLLVLGDFSVQPLDLRREAPPPNAQHKHEPEGDGAEEHAEVEARDGGAEAPLGRGRRQVDPDHVPLSPGRRSPSPTTTASRGPAWSSSSAENWPASYSTRSS